MLTLYSAYEHCLANPFPVYGSNKTKFPTLLPEGTKPTKNEALAAVTVPCGLTKAGFSLAICCRVDTRIPLSAVTVSAFPKARYKKQK